jgi:hypothetical protein
MHVFVCLQSHGLGRTLTQGHWRERLAKWPGFVLVSFPHESLPLSNGAKMPRSCILRAYQACVSVCVRPCVDTIMQVLSTVCGRNLGAVAGSRQQAFHVRSLVQSCFPFCQVIKLWPPGVCLFFMNVYAHSLDLQECICILSCARTIAWLKDASQT